MAKRKITAQPYEAQDVDQVCTTPAGARDGIAPRSQKTCIRITPMQTIALMPFRYSVVGAAEDSGVNEAYVGALTPAMPAQCGKNLVPLKGKARYAIQSLREGHIYVFVLRSSWGCENVYTIDKEGWKIVKQPLVMEGFDGIVLNMLKDIEEIRVLYTPDVLTDRMIREYENDDELRNTLQKFSVKTTAGDDKLSPEEVLKHVADVLAEDKEHLTDILGSQYHTTAITKKATIEKGLKALKEDVNVLHKRGFGLVLNDPIGITQELNSYRNSALDKLRPWLDQLDYHSARTAAEQATNERKVMVLGAVKDVRQALEKGYVAKKNDALDEDAERHRQSLAYQQEILSGLERINPATLQNDRARQERLERIAQYKEKIARQEEGRKRWLEEEKARALIESKGIWKKYANDLDMEAMTDFEASYKKEVAKHEALLLTRVDDHLAWIKSQQLIDGFAAYDRAFAYDPMAPGSSGQETETPKQKESRQAVGSGFAFQAQVGDAITGLNYVESAKAQIDEWVKDQGIDTTNILMRANCLNQESIEAATQAVMLAALGAIPGNPDSFNYTTMLEPWVKALAGLYDAADKAIGHPDNAVWVSTNKMGMASALFANTITGFFRVAKNPGEIRFARALVGMFAGWTGGVAANVSLASLTGESAEKAIRNRKTVVDFSREYAKGAADQYARGEYGKIRWAILGGAIEGYGLYIRSRQENKSARIKWEIAAGGMMVTSAVLALLSLGVEAIETRFAKEAAVGAKELVGATTQTGARVSLGVVRSFSGALASVAGGIGAWYDFVDTGKAWKENERGLAGAFMVRGVGSALLSAAGAALVFSSLAPVFEWAVGKLSPGVLKSFLAFVFRGATWVAVRAAFILRFAVAMNVLTLGLSVVIWLITDDALEDWCQMSCFRKRKSVMDKHYNDVGAELSGLYQAFGEVKA